MDDTTKQILEIVTNIHEQMATKHDLEEVRRELQIQITENTQAIAELSAKLSILYICLSPARAFQ